MTVEDLKALHTDVAALAADVRALEGCLAEVSGVLERLEGVMASFNANQVTYMAKVGEALRVQLATVDAIKAQVSAIDRNTLAHARPVTEQ